MIIRAGKGWQMINVNRDLEGTAFPSSIFSIGLEEKKEEKEGGGGLVSIYDTQPI